MLKKIIIFILFFLITGFVFAPLVFAQEKSLEVDYPTVPGATPPSAQTSLPGYVKYVFTFIIVASGIIGLIVLIIGGIRYSTSTGQPEKLKQAKSQILSAFWGIIILLGSYIILSIINPQLTILDIGKMPKIPTAELPPPPVYTIPNSDLLTRVKKLAENTKETPEPVKETAKKIKELTDKCDCENTKPICLCSGGGLDSECQPKTCYNGSSAHPCPDKEEIKNLQKKIIDQKDVILYYEQRVLFEKNDLETDIKDFINDELSWYEKEITAEEEIISQIQEQEAKESEQRKLDFLKERKEWLEKEKNYKQKLVEKLDELAKSIKKMDEPASKIPELSAQCSPNVKTKCQASCKTGEDYGCHDKVKGCQPDKCKGGNPCPTEEIQTELSKIDPLVQEIKKISEEIISIVNSIEKEKIMQIIL